MGAAQKTSRGHRSFCSLSHNSTQNSVRLSGRPRILHAQLNARGTAKRGKSCFCRPCAQRLHSCNQVYFINDIVWSLTSLTRPRQPSLAAHRPRWQVFIRWWWYSIDVGVRKVSHCAPDRLCMGQRLQRRHPHHAPPQEHRAVRAATQDLVPRACLSVIAQGGRSGLVSRSDD